jgi:FkbM family methyltransferase
MKRFLQRTAAAVLRATRLQYFPVRVRRGLPAGARWTLFPWTSYWRGGYEPDVERAILGLGDLTGKVCWDLGAHYGYYSVGLALRTGPAGEVVALEPFPASFDRLERHRRMNRLDWLKPFPCAASDAEGEDHFILAAGETVHHLAYEGETRTEATSTIRIRKVRLDDLVRAGRIRPPDFVKVDVEGHGHHALAGAIESVRARRPVILIGFHSPQEVAGTEALLRPLGYDFTPVGPRAPAGRVGADYLARAG